MKKLVIIVFAALVASCTDNQKAKQFGGVEHINLPKNRRLLNVTWKDNNLWYTTAQMPIGYDPKETKFQEHSSFGMLEGTVIFHESKSELKQPIQSSFDYVNEGSTYHHD